jgi:hypothetical protein
MKSKFVVDERCATSWSFITGCTTSAPDVSSPRGYGRVFVVDHRLQSLRLFSVDFFLSGARPALPMGVAPEAIAKFFGYRLKNINMYA